jgi:hypothetical protein
MKSAVAELEKRKTEALKGRFNGLVLFSFGAHCSNHGPIVRESVTLVEVVTDGTGGAPKTQLWVAAANPDQAVTLVLCAVPEGWTATTTGGQLPPEQAALLNLKPGEVRELTK